MNPLINSEHIWVELENYYGRLDFLVKLITEDELKPNEVNIENLWQKLKSNLDAILSEKKNLDVAIFTLFAISKILDLKLGFLLNLQNEDEEYIPFNFAFIFELQKIRRILNTLENSMNCGTKNFVRGNWALQKLINVDVKTLENLSLQKIYMLYKSKMSQLKLTDIPITKSEYNWHDIITELLNIINKHKKLSFMVLVKEIKNTYKILLYFVAILELVKENILEVSQEELYKDFVVTLKENRPNPNFPVS